MLLVSQFRFRYQCGTLCILLVILQSLSDRAEGTSEIGPGKLSSALRRRLSLPGDTDDVIAWIDFADKPYSSFRGAPPAFAHAELSIDELRHSDAPVSPAYVARVREILASEQPSGDVRVVSNWLNAVSVRCSRGQLELLSALPFVARVDVVRTFHRQPLAAATDLSAVGGPRARERRQAALDPFYGYTAEGLPAGVRQANENGTYGQGVRVLVIDSGFEIGHEVFGNLTVVAAHNFVGNNSDVSSVGPGEAPQQADHGTAVLSVMAAYKPGVLVGPAWRAEYVLAKTELVNQTIRSEEDWFIQAVEWGVTDLSVDVVTASVGYPEWYSWASTDGVSARSTAAVNQAVARGVVVVLAAGNEGNTGVAPPADAPYAVVVGAVDRTGQRPEWSSIGPTYDGVIKPDLVALGAEVYVAVNASSSSGTGYTRLDGTSFSAPFVAASVVLMRQLKPDYTPRQIRLALLRTASNQPPNRFVGWGQLNLTRALQGNTPLNSCVFDSELGGCVTAQGECSMSGNTSGTCQCFSSYFDYDCKYTKVLCESFCNTNGGSCGSGNACNCKTGYSGFDCTTAPSAVDSPAAGDSGFVLTTAWQIGIAFLVLAFILAAILLAYVIWWRFFKPKPKDTVERIVSPDAGKFKMSETRQYGKAGGGRGYTIPVKTAQRDENVEVQQIVVPGQNIADLATGGTINQIDPESGVLPGAVPETEALAASGAPLLPSAAPAGLDTSAADRSASADIALVPPASLPPKAEPPAEPAAAVPPAAPPRVLELETSPSSPTGQGPDLAPPPPPQEELPPLPPPEAAAEPPRVIATPQATPIATPAPSPQAGPLPPSPTAATAPPSPLGTRAPMGGRMVLAPIVRKPLSPMGSASAADLFSAPPAAPAPVPEPPRASSMSDLPVASTLTRSDSSPGSPLPPFASKGLPPLVSAGSRGKLPPLASSHQQEKQPSGILASPKTNRLKKSVSFKGLDNA